MMILQMRYQGRRALDSFLSGSSPLHGVAERYKFAGRGRKFGTFTDPGSARRQSPDVLATSPDGLATFSGVGLILIEGFHFGDV